MSNKISKTKKILIEVSRELFAKYGKRNITMNDIAEASRKGRRTLYTYFSNKEDIFRAVVDKELNYLSEELTKAFACDCEPDEKLKKNSHHTFRYGQTNCQSQWILTCRFFQGYLRS